MTSVAQVSAVEAQDAEAHHRVPRALHADEIVTVEELRLRVGSER